MEQPANYEVREPSGAKPKLRGDLVITPHDLGGRPCYLVEDPLRSKFFRIGQREFALISRLDGRTTIATALGLAAAELGADALTESEALAVCRWLVDSHLAITPESTSADRLASRRRQSKVKALAGALNPLAIKLPLASPDRFLEWLLPRARWMLGSRFFVAWCVLVSSSLVVALLNWRKLAGDTRTVFDTSHWPLMFAAWIGLKLVHETWHGLVCKKYGGRVTRAGVIFLFFAPVAFVDVTSAWRFRSKWQRMATAAAGMYVELFISALALLGWWQTSDGTVHRLCFDVALMAGFGSLLVNANPLMRFDGYYLLADWLEIPNLYAAGQQYLRYLFERRVLGVPAALPNWPAAQARFIKCYGVLAMIWRWVLYGSLSLLLVGALGDLGAVLAAMLAAAWFGPPLARAAAALYQLIALRQIGLRRLIGLATTCGLLLAACALWASRPSRIVVPAVVEYAPLVVVRADGPGFVRKVPVRAGQRVAEGQVIAVLENEELRVQFRELAIEMEQSLVKSRMHQQAGELAKCQAEKAKHDSLEEKHREVQAQLDALIVRAPRSGEIISRGLDTLLGRYLEAGEEIAVIGDEGVKELIVAIPQEEVELLTAAVNSPVEVQLVNRPRFVAKLADVDPRASVEPVHAALTARVGGPLAVKLARPRQNHQTGADDYELLEPMFCGKVALQADSCCQLHAGEVAQVVLTSSARSHATQFYVATSRWIRNQLRVAENQ